MKTTIIFLMGLMISVSLYSNPKNKNFKLVPRGSFKVQDNSTFKTVSVESFWMSNEITNKEFRQFFNQMKNLPKDTIVWKDYTVMMNNGKSKPEIIKEAYSDIIDKLIDENVLKSIPEKENYFIDKKYDNYPVVGVTYEGARYYCIWRTNEENKNNKEKNDVLSMDYRIPTEYEWEYASSCDDIISSKDLNRDLHQVQKGEKNKLGLFNLNSNTAEWTSTSEIINDTEYKIVKGCSWKSKSNDSKRELVAPMSATDYIGFRIVKSNIQIK